jgi:hypothetical protein
MKRRRVHHAARRRGLTMRIPRVGSIADKPANFSESRFEGLALRMGASLSIVGFAAGGPADIIARLISQWLSERLAQQFIVTMIVRTPLLSIRLSMALKPGRISMGSAPLTAAS